MTVSIYLYISRVCKFSCPYFLKFCLKNFIFKIFPFASSFQAFKKRKKERKQIEEDEKEVAVAGE